VVENVEEFGPELKVEPFREKKFLCQGKIGFDERALTCPSRAGGG
jgi:hypothetical protein